MYKHMYKMGEHVSKGGVHVLLIYYVIIIVDEEQRLLAESEWRMQSSIRSFSVRYPILEMARQPDKSPS